MPLDPIEEIKTRLNIIDIVKGYIPLQLAGANYKSRCPFHQEKSASFMVSPTKQIWHCFGCSEGGDMFTFVMKQEGVEFGESLKILAEKAGVELEQHGHHVSGEKNRLLRVLELAAEYYYQALSRAPHAQAAREYVAKRGIDQAIIDEFRIGFALPDFEALTQFLLSRKIPINEIIQAGLCIKKERGYGYFDRFRSRLMIPIRNAQGQVVGFSGRIIDDNDISAKYINSPQTVLYDKGKIVFGLDKAKTVTREKDFVILVEGQMDYLALVQAGTRNVVATSGTALTADQVKLLKRFTSHLYFAFDSDSAGATATMRGIHLALQEGMNVRIIQLLKKADGTSLYKDPDECVKNNLGDWERAVEDAVNFVEFYFSKMIPLGGIPDAFEKKKVARILLSVIALVPDALEQDHWVQKLSGRLSLSENILWEELKKLKNQPASQSEYALGTVNTQTATKDDILLALILAHPQHSQNVFEKVQPAMFSKSIHQKLYSQIVEEYTKKSVKNLLEKGDFGDLSAEVATLGLLADKDFAGSDLSYIQKTIDTLATSLRHAWIKQRIHEYQQLIQKAEVEDDRSVVAQYMQECHVLQKALKE